MTHMEAARVPKKDPHAVGVRELRQNLSVYLRRVKAGETLHVTERGEEVALLTPKPAKEMSVLERLIAEGKATPAKGDLNKFLEENPPLEAPPGTPSSEEMLNEMREDRF